MEKLWKDDNWIKRLNEANETEDIDKQLDDLLGEINSVRNRHNPNKKYMAKRYDALFAKKREQEASDRGKSILTKSALTALIKKFTGWSTMKYGGSHMIRGYRVRTSGEFEIEFDKYDDYMLVDFVERIPHEELETLAGHLKDEGVDIIDLSRTRMRISIFKENH